MILHMIRHVHIHAPHLHHVTHVHMPRLTSRVRHNVHTVGHAARSHRSPK